MNTNKIDLIKAEVERLKPNLIHGACASQIAMETTCKEEAYNEVLAILDTMQEEQEEPAINELEKVVEEIVDPTVLNAYCVKEIANRLRKTMIEPVSEDLEEASRNYVDNEEYGDDVYFSIKASFKAGAKWQKSNLWKPADGDDLPEIDMEVIALLDNGKVAFAHRPNPDGWYAKSIITEKVEHYTPKTYGKGGWNIPDVKYWLDVRLPKEIEL